MEIGKLESVVRSVMGLGSAQPNLLAIAGAGAPVEFSQAARTLAEKETQQERTTSILRSRLEWI